MKYLIASDPHFNPQRQGGTTNQSRIELEEHLFVRFNHTLDTIPHDALIIVGDLNAKYSVSEKTLLNTYGILQQENHCIILRGNHDSGSMKQGEISSLELLDYLMPNLMTVFHQPHTIGEMHFVPHCFNQEEFDQHIEAVEDNQLVFIHANLDNTFAENADHSLNFSSEQYNSLKDRGCTVVIGHEHAALDIDRLHIVGCHYPTSIADCLGGDKRVLLYDSDTKQITSVETWNKAEEYIEMDWRDIQATDHKFIRINGECEVVEYPEIVRSIAKLRKESSAFIIASNVKVVVKERENVEQQEVTGFNILELLLENVDEEFREEVRTCI